MFCFTSFQAWEYTGHIFTKTPHTFLVTESRSTLLFLVVSFGGGSSAPFLRAPWAFLPVNATTYPPRDFSLQVRLLSRSCWEQTHKPQVCAEKRGSTITSWVVGPTRLKNMLGKLHHETPGIGVKIKHIWIHHLDHPRLPNRNPKSGRQLKKEVNGG